MLFTLAFFVFLLLVETMVKKQNENTYSTYNFVNTIIEL